MIVALLSLVAAADPSWTVQIDPLTVALGSPHVQVERAITPALSVYAGPHSRLFSAPWGEPEPYFGVGGELGVRVFVFGEAPTGGWVMARGVLAHVWSPELGATAAGG